MVVEEVVKVWGLVEEVMRCDVVVMHGCRCEVSSERGEGGSGEGVEKGDKVWSGGGDGKV